MPDDLGSLIHAARGQMGIRPPEAVYEPSSRPRGRAVGKLRILSLADALDAPPRAYLLPGLMAPRELSVWWGAPKCGKSFLLMRLAFGLAIGRGMWGKEPARQLRVMYGAAEGEGGLGNRLAALKAELGDPGENLILIAQRMHLGGTMPEHLEDFIRAAREHRADLVIVDTVARTFGDGDEDRAQDMGHFIVAMDRIREEAGAHVAVVHHGSKDPAAKTPRGSGALLGAADLVVKVSKGVEDAPSMATVEHAKDDADGIELPFRLRVVALDDCTADGRRTCLAEEADGSEAGTKRPSVSKGTKRALGYLHDLLATGGDKLPSGNSFPTDSTLRGVRFEDWRALCRERSLSANGEKSAENKAFARAAEALLDARIIATGEYEGVRLVWVAREAGT